MKTVIGIDIGTTTISISLIEQSDGRVVKSATYSNNSGVISKDSFSDLQDPEIIYDIVLRALTDIVKEYEVSCIGITGQMHGIVYIDKDGNAVSPLYTWRDACGNEMYERDKSYCTVLSEKTGYSMAAGFGCTTFYYHTVNHRIPETAVKFCTIQDYIVIKLVNKKEPVVHISNAASFGMFDLNNKCFDLNAFKSANVDASFLPTVTKDNIVVGYYKDSIPVAVAIGDNQASFLGSVQDMENSVLINIGTGSQISYITKDIVKSSSLESRPLVGDYMIQAGSSLCGGRALAILESFFRKIAEVVIKENVQSAYPGIDACIEKMIVQDNYKEKNSLKISTKFSGTRSNPDERGYINNISIDNFTPEDLIVGFLNGAINELLEMYIICNCKHTVLVGSGNGLRKNVLLKKILEEKFNMKLCVPRHNEEAAYGAALFSLVCSGFCENIHEAQKLIVYEK